MNDFSYDGLKIKEATQIQIGLRKKIRLKPFTKPINTIAGADLSFNRFGTTFYAGIIVLTYPGMCPLSYSLIKTEVRFPYVPGYLAFREIPALMKAWNQLPVKPDVMVIDGHGIAHPRRMGIAAHFGVLTKHPTIGCAKKILFGKFKEPGPNKGNYSRILDVKETIGWALRTKNKTKPVFVAPGNLIEMEQSKKIILHCSMNHRIPEPTRLAHDIVNKFRKGLLEEGYHNLQQP